MDGLPDLAADFWNDEQMSKRIHLSRCRSGKVRFRDKREAVRTLHRIQLIASYQIADRGFTKHEECRAYSCSICKGFHLTSGNPHAMKRAA